VSDDDHLAEERVRAALTAGTAAAAADIGRVLAALDAARALAGERWTAIGALAPAAKRHRARTLELERTIAAAAEHLDAGAVAEARAVLRSIT
jgi:hypothetical protein